MTQFLHPQSVSLPSQGAFQFYPEVAVFDEATPQDLENAINAGTGIQATDADNFWVVEDIKYQVYNTLSPMAETRYSALVYATRVEII